jgi:LAO/AO transport system kinase
MPEKPEKPEWVPTEGGKGFATSVMKGVEERGHDGLPPTASQQKQPAAASTRRRQLSVDDHVQGVLTQDRTILGRTITLIESNSAAHMETAQQVLTQLLPHTGNSLRVGITGVPGVGKSTFIEALGKYLCQEGHRVAVLAVDPTSSITRGSILGDKARMEKLAIEPNAYIRPSPSGGTLGGVTRKSRETMLVCEAAGFDVLLVETVGVGQSEVTVRSMVDFFLLLALPGAGDELQGIKRGVTELADAIVVNKADGDNKTRAEAAKTEYTKALHYLPPSTEGWKSRAHTCSALKHTGIAELWATIQEFHTQTTASGVFTSRRKRQTRDWLYAMVEEYLHTHFFSHPSVEGLIPQLEVAVIEGSLPVTSAARQLLAAFENRLDPDES